QFRADARNCFKEELPIRALNLDYKTSESKRDGKSSQIVTVP
ncbi:hypothetical protein ALC53_12741, partial [Atta colombica]